MDLNKLQNEYEKKLDNQEKSIQDIQERAEGLSNERTIVKARFHLDTSLWLADQKVFRSRATSSEHQIENLQKNKILETKDEILDKENDIARMKRKLNRKKSDIQEVIDHVTFVIVRGQVQSGQPWVKVDGLCG